MTETAATVHPERSEAKSVIVTTMQQTWWFGLGVLAMLGEQTARVAGALIDKGREVEPSVLKPVKRAASSVSDTTEGAGTRLRRVAEGIGDVRVPAALRRAAGPSKEEFEKLADEVKELRARLGDKIEKATDQVD